MSIHIPGYFQPPFERPPTNNMGFQHSAPNVVGTGPPISGDPDPANSLFVWLYFAMPVWLVFLISIFLVGHTVPQMLPSRPDISALNCWRPA